MIPADLHEVLSAILGSLARGKTTRAIELTQVMMLIVGKKERDELKRLLGFMSAASTKNAVKLSYEVCSHEDYKPFYLITHPTAKLAPRT